MRFEALAKHTEFPDCLSTQAFLARAIGTVEATQRAKTAAAELAAAQAQAQGSVPSVSSALGLASVLALAKACDTNALLKAANLSELPFVNQCDQAVMDKLYTETQEAKSQNRTAYLYIDITAAGVLLCA